MHRQIPLVHTCSLGETHSSTDEQGDEKELMIDCVRRLVRKALLPTWLTKAVVIMSIIFVRIGVTDSLKMVPNNRSNRLYGRRVT